MDKDEYKDRIKKQIEVMEAYLEGKDIQVSYGGVIWEDTEHPEWTWDVIKYRVKPDEAEKPKKPMTCRQLAELLAKGYGQTTYFYGDGTARLVGSSFEYEKDNEEDSISVMRKIRPWGSDEWLDPTVDIYEEFMNRKEKERRYQNIKISIKKLNGDDFEVESEPEEDTIRDYSDDYEGEPEVGEVFKISGRTLKCIEEKNCKGCAFQEGPASRCPDIACSNAFRKDGKSVVFVNVSKMENTTASEDSSATVSKEEKVGVHRRTLQEIADFFDCYVAMDWNGAWYLYEYEPMLSYSAKKWFCKRGGCTAFGSDFNSSAFLFIEISETCNWRTLYRPHKEPLVMEEEDD